MRDIERSVSFYREVFGMDLIRRYEGPMGKHPLGIQVVLSTSGASDLIALSQVPGEPIGPAGVNHFGFTLVDDSNLDAAIEEAGN